MNKRVKDIIKELNTKSKPGITKGLDQLRLMEDFTSEEKIELTEALTSVFYHLHDTETTSMMRLAVRVERRIATFGKDVIPFLFNEIIDADGESVVYLGKAFAMIGPEGVNYMLREWSHHRDDESALINLTQTLSNCKFSDVHAAIPYIIAANKGKNFHLTSMTLCTIGRLIERSNPSLVNKTLIHTLFDHAFSFLSSTKPLVRRSAVRALGKMCKKKLLSRADEKKVANAFLAIEGKDDKHNWDDAFIVRKEAEKYMKYIDLVVSILSGFE